MSISLDAILAITELSMAVATFGMIWLTWKVFHYDRSITFIKSQLHDLYLPIRYNFELIDVAPLDYTKMPGREFVDKTFQERYEKFFSEIKANAFLATSEFRATLNKFLYSLNTLSTNDPELQTLKKQVRDQVEKDTEELISRLERLVRPIHN